MTALVGRSLGRYRLDALLGRGGMAEVYRAVDTRLGRTVAVKVILPSYASDPSFLERFLREARLVAQLEHPNVLPVYDFGEDLGLPYLVLPYLEGGTLVARMGGERQPFARLVSWIAQLAAALDEAHAAGILHRDVKPSNILVARDGRLVLADFGIARMWESASALTATGTVVGTPAYMAPELAKGQPASPASDLYALAVLAYELLVGRPPFWGENSLAILHQQVAEPPPPLSHWVEGLPRGIEERMAEALSKDPARRPLPCRAFADGLASLLSVEERAALPALPTRPLRLSGSAARSAAMGGAAEAVGTNGAIGSSAARTDLGSAPTILEANGSGPSSSNVDQVSRSALTPGIGRWTQTRLAWTALAAAATLLAGGVWWLQLRRQGEVAFSSTPAGLSAPLLSPGEGATAAGPTPVAEEATTAASPQKAVSSSDRGATPGGTDKNPSPAAESTREEAAPNSAHESPTHSRATQPPAPPAVAPHEEGRPPASLPPESGPLAAVGPMPPAPAPPGIEAEGQVLRREGHELVPRLLRPSRRLSEGDFRAGLAWAQRVLARQPEDSLAADIQLFARGGLQYLAGDVAGAKAAVGRIVLRPPGDAPVPFPLLFLRRIGRDEGKEWELAIAYGDPQHQLASYLEPELAKDPRDPRLLFSRAVLQRWEGRHQDSIADGSRVYESFAMRPASRPLRAQAAQLIAEEYALLHDFDAALTWFRTAIDLAGPLGPLLAYEAGMAARRMGHDEESNHLLDQACRHQVEEACVDRDAFAEPTPAHSP